MPPAITLDELLRWNDETSRFWHAHLAANPSLLVLPCSIGGAATVQALVQHIWGVELRWAQRLAGLPETLRDAVPQGPLDALFALHQQATDILGQLLNDPAQDWNATYTLTSNALPPDKRMHSRRKTLAHALLHAQRHWAQLATLVRVAGFPSGFGGDLLLSAALA